MSGGVPRESALVLEAVELAAWRDVYASAGPGERAALGIRSRELGGGLVMAVDRDDSLLSNRALGLGLREPLGAATLDALLEHFHGHDAGFAVNLSPFAEPRSIELELARRGFGTFFHHLKWARGVAPPPEARTGLRVVEAGPERAREWAELSRRIHDTTPAHAAWAARVVGRPGWGHYFACDGDTPVAVGALYVRDGAAWLGMGATLPGHRRHGAQGALLARRIADALARGARTFTTETAPAWPDLPGESLRNVARAGFHVAYERPSWIWPVPSWP